MSSTRVQALVLATAIVAGYTGAAACSAWGLPSVPVATGFGPDDGLTRYVLTASSGTASDELLAALEATEGVVSAQRLRDGRALVATDGLGPHHLEVVPDGSGGSGDGSDGSDGDSGGSGGSAGPVETTGPTGERLVRTSKFATLGSIWSMSCSVSCSGVAI